jgi:hypothetical protein
MDKICYKFDIWELLFPFATSQLWRLQPRLSRRFAVPENLPDIHGVYILIAAEFGVPLI